MQKQQLSTVIFVLFLSISSSINSYYSYNASQKGYQPRGTMEDRITNMMEHVDSMFGDAGMEVRKKTKSKQTPSVVYEQDALSIAFSLGQGITQFDASAQEDQLTIDIPEKNSTIKITYNKKKRFLSIATSQSEKKETKEKGAYERHESFSSAQHGQTIDADIDLQNAQLAYKNGVLTISIPKIKKAEKPTKKLAVDIG